VKIDSEGLTNFLHRVIERTVRGVLFDVGYNYPKRVCTAVEDWQTYWKDTWCPDNFLMHDKGEPAWADAKVKIMPGQPVYGIWSRSRERHWRTEDGEVFCTHDKVEAERELECVLEQHHLAGSEYGLEDFGVTVVNALTQEDEPPPLYGIWRNGQWCRYTTGVLAFGTDRDVMEHEKYDWDSEAEVREVPLAMRWWLARGVNVVC